MLFDRQEFIETINALRSQYDFDVDTCKVIGKALNCEFPLNNNSRLTNQVFKLLHKQFPPSTKGYCVIQHFCYEQNFGRNGSSLTVEILWDCLIKQFSNAK